MKSLARGVLSFYGFAAVALLFLLLSGRVAFGNDPLPPPVVRVDPLPPPVMSPAARPQHTAVDGTIYEEWPDGSLRALPGQTLPIQQFAPSMPRNYVVPGVTTPRNFQSGPIPHAGHHCPECGVESLATRIQRGSGPVPGTHLHHHCNSWWYH